MVSVAETPGMLSIARGQLFSRRAQSHDLPKSFTPSELGRGRIALRRLIMVRDLFPERRALSSVSIGRGKSCDASRTCLVKSTARVLRILVCKQYPIFDEPRII